MSDHRTWRISAAMQSDCLAPGKPISPSTCNSIKPQQQSCDVT